MSIEPAGPAPSLEIALRLIPNNLRALAGYVIETCVAQGGGIGGFVTYGIQNSERYLETMFNSVEEDAVVNSDGQHTDGTFVTISVYGQYTFEHEPGNCDPLVAGHLSAFLDAYVGRYLGTDRTTELLQVAAQVLRSRTTEMARGGWLTWWGAGFSGSSDSHTEGSTDDTATSPNNDFVSRIGGSGDAAGKMTYQCDASLGGAPDPIDCEKLSWSGLKPADTVETLQAGVAKFYSQGTCTLGISSAISTTITWAHLLAAFETINNLCVQNPVKAVKGGRAYYGPQSISSWINGKHRRDSVGNVNGTDALPQGINATVFRHDNTSQLACEWALAQQGKNITMCEAG